MQKLLVLGSLDIIFLKHSIHAAYWTCSFLNVPLHLNCAESMSYPDLAHHIEMF